MNNNSYLCRFIRNHPEDWELLLSQYPYMLKIKREGNLAIFSYDLRLKDDQGRDN